MDNLEFLNILLLFKCILEPFVEVLILFFFLFQLLLGHYYYDLYLQLSIIYEDKYNGLNHSFYFLSLFGIKKRKLACQPTKYSYFLSLKLYVSRAFSSHFEASKYVDIFKSLELAPPVSTFPIFMTFGYQNITKIV